jgi:hypothetical protein
MFQTVVKLVHLVGFIVQKFVMIHGHTNIKFVLNSWDIKIYCCWIQSIGHFLKVLFSFSSVKMCSLLNPTIGLFILLCAAWNMGINSVDTNLLNSVQNIVNIWGCFTLVQIFETEAMQRLRWLGAGLGMHRPVFCMRPVHVGFVVDKVKLGS